MADISDIQKEELDDSAEIMEIDDGDDDDVDYNLRPDASGTGICNVGGSGDEGGRDELLHKLKHYISSNTNFSRQRIGRILVEIFRTAIYNAVELDVNDIMQWVLQIAEDPDIQIRLDLIEQLPHVATLAAQSHHLFGDVLHDHLLGIIIKYLQDLDDQVRMAAQAAVLKLTKKRLLDNTTIEVKLLPVIETLCRNADFINSGVSLMSKMAKYIGKKLTEKIFLDKYITLCEEEAYYVRNICVSHFEGFCTAVSKKALSQKLFPAFVEIYCDEEWGIRKACEDIMMPVSCRMPLPYRRFLLADLLAMHLNDESKWVRMSAFEILGPFISTFAKQFTKVTYNRHRELVFTSEQDTRYSLRYPYDSIFLPKNTIRRLSLDVEDFNSMDNFNSPVIIQEPIFEEDGGVDDDENDDDDAYEYQESHVSAIRACKMRILKKQWKYKMRNRPVAEDAIEYNSFRFHYIEPNLLLDQDLVEAAERLYYERLESMSANNSVSDINETVTVDRYPADEYEIINFDDPDVVPRHLIDSFLSMVDPEQCENVSADIPHQCAFSFPAVVLALGREHWPELKQTYQSLAGASQWKVRRTLASSIHEVANILGEELTATDLVPIYNGFIKDLDEVRIDALKHLATFLKILQPVDRRQYLPRLKEFRSTDNESNWRFREELAVQLLEVVNLFGPADVEKHIEPLALDMLSDKVAAVRHVAVSLVTQIVSHLSNNERLVKALFHRLRRSLLVCVRKWTKRQTFVFVCAKLISSNAISGDRFSHEMLPNLLKLSSDEVPNVRLAVARTLSKNVVPMGQEWLGIEQAEEVERKLREMRSDPDRDVRVLAGGDETLVGDISSPSRTEQSRNILF